MGRSRMFFGTYTPKLDEKGRLFLPAKFRDDLERRARELEYL